MLLLLLPVLQRRLPQDMLLLLPGNLHGPILGAPRSAAAARQRGPQLRRPLGGRLPPQSVQRQAPVQRDPDGRTGSLTGDLTSERPPGAGGACPTP